MAEVEAWDGEAACAEAGVSAAGATATGVGKLIFNDDEDDDETCCGDPWKRWAREGEESAESD